MGCAQEILLRVENIEKYYGGLGTVTRALDQLSFHVRKGEYISIMGASGSGKTTLLNCLSTIDSVSAGHIMLDGKDITVYPEYKRAREIGRLFQDPLKGTAPHMTIEENLGLAYSRGKRTTLSRAIKKGDRSFFIEKLKELGLGLEDRISTTVGLLSGGQRQALTLLMSTIVTPKLLLLDEPAAGMNPNETAELIRSSHTTFLGPKIADKSYLDGYQTLLKNMGYRIWVTQAQLKQALGKATLILTWENDGTAPFYKNWPVVVTVTDSSGAVIEEKTLDWKISELMPGEKNVTTVKLDTRGLLDKARSDRNICVEIRDPMTEKAAVRLANKELDQKAQKKQMIVFKSGE